MSDIRLIGVEDGQAVWKDLLTGDEYATGEAPTPDEWRELHENHDERYEGGCPDCDAELDIEMQANRPHPNSISYPEAEEGLAIRRRLPENQ